MLMARLMPALLGVLLVMSCGAPGTGREGTCLYDGQERANRTQFVSTDGCNKCFCMDGELVCTRKACGLNTCTFEGSTVQDGATFAAGDGCNTCTCQSGNVQCTTKTCAQGSCTSDGKSYKEGDRFPAGDGCNTCTCSEGKVLCSRLPCSADGCQREGGLPCKDGLYCDLAGHCGANKEVGTCQPKPKTCDGEVALVCGCDETTYANACVARFVGVSIKRQGPCEDVTRNCNVNGKSYTEGASFPRGDGCNLCLCIRGKVVCTSATCSNDLCIFEGKTYENGSRFPSPADCGTCLCKDGKVSCTTQSCEKDCVYGGQVYKHGTRFPSFDGCNVCLCDNGALLCSREDCGTRTCKANGKTYREGESAPAGDGCNTCTCSKGTFTCSTDPCPTRPCTFLGKVYQDGASWDAGDGCNKCLCTRGKVTCTSKQCTPQTCSTDGRFPCPAGTFCRREPHCGTNSLPGTCTPKPLQCPTTVAMVCGCDGKTYQNGCAAHAAGASVRAQGVCPPAGQPCQYEGTTYAHGDVIPAGDGCNQCQCHDGKMACTGLNCGPATCEINGRKNCALGSFCHPGTACQWVNNQGTCQTIPTSCDQTSAPVCGCDGKTYLNACSAFQKSIAVAHKGACPPAPSCTHNGQQIAEGEVVFASDGCNSCTCKDGKIACTNVSCKKQSCKPSESACASGSFCFSSRCDADGTCMVKPAACSIAQYPVCGCNKRSFANPCAAHKLGHSVDYSGKCK